MNEKLKTIKIIHFGICAGVIVAYYVLGNWSSTKIFELPEINQNSILYLLVPIGAYLLSNFLFKSQLKSAELKPKLEDNMAIYQTAAIVRWAILEGAAFIILILKEDFILFGILIVFYLILLHPTKERIIKELNHKAL
ncbi:MFS transporter [Aestuariibaculum marinum]|uniref:MFS transporter n=1 Tax=Aestuariibaculum marinum TaxID=2683592 RepID=A0A8J6U4J6_9FLAO|nr:MFS transporter [Aestuariibaculum marinum]MBD0824245.1 MFS transporter [Aestuariibaculum marinum]